jgi:O-antigen/teichoic acid export membrane protein
VPTADLDRNRRHASLTMTSGLLGGSQVVNRLAILVVLALLARGAGAAAVGYYGLATLAASLAATAVSFGLPTYLTRSVPAGLVAPPTVARIHVARLAVLAAVAVAGYLPAAGLLPDGIWYGFLLIFVSGLLEQWNETAWPLVRGTRMAWREPLVNAATGLMVVGLCSVDAWRGGLTFDDAAGYLVAVAVIRSIAAAAAVGMPRLLRTPGRGELRIHAGGALPYLASDLLGLLYFRGDVFVLAMLVPATLVGEYVSAATVVNPAVQVAAAMAAGGLAYASARLFPGQPGTDDSTAVFTFFRTAGMAAAGALYVILPAAIALLFADNDDILALAMILAVFLALRFANYGLSSILLALGRASSRLLVLALSICGNVALNLALDGRYGAYGAAWATVLTELIVGGSFLWFLRSNHLVGPAVLSAAWVLSLAVVMVVLMELIGPVRTAPVVGALFLAAAAATILCERRASRRTHVSEGA